MFLLGKNYTHNAVSTMYAAKREERREKRLTDSKVIGIDWAVALTFQALHDLFGWGEGRFSKINSFWENLPDDEPGYIWRQLEELEKEKFDKTALWAFSDTIERIITNHTKDAVLRAKTRDMIGGIVIFSTFFAFQEYGFRAKRIQRLQDKLKDYAWLLKKKDVTIWEFMQCLEDECNVQFPALERHRELYGPVFAGTRKQLKQWEKEQQRKEKRNGDL